MKIIAIFATASGEMLEWLKRHAWKACIRQNRISGSNPDLSARQDIIYKVIRRTDVNINQISFSKAILAPCP